MSILHFAAGVLAWGAILFLAIKAWNLPAGRSRTWRVWFHLGVIATLCIWRAPVLLLDAELNVDESLMLAQGMKFQTDWLPWRSVDGTTSGPLNSYILMWPLLVGLKLTYFTARLTGLACILIMVWFVFKALANVIGLKRAPLAALPLVTFYAFAHGKDFVHYSSEHLPLVLLAAGAWLLTELLRRPSVPKAWWLGALLGAVPFSKLQAAPIAVYLFAVGAGILLFRSRGLSRAQPGKFAMLAALAIGGLSIPAAILIPVAMGGAWNDFLYRYIVNNLLYAAGHDRSVFGVVLWLILRSGILACFLFGALLWSGIAVCLIARHTRPISRVWHAGFAIVIGYLLITGLAVTKTGNIFPHYLLLTVLPVTFAVAWLLRGSVQFAPKTPLRPMRSSRIVALFLGTFVAPQAAFYAAESMWYSTRGRPSDLTQTFVSPHVKYTIARRSGEIPGLRFGRPAVAAEKVGPDAISDYVRQQTAAGDTLAIWGWMPKWYVEAGLAPATRDAINQFAVIAGDHGEFYRKGFLGDLIQAMPRVFIDSGRTTTVRHTMYPPLADFIAQHYVLSLEVPRGNRDGSAGDTAAAGSVLPVQIYLRK